MARSLRALTVKDMATVAFTFWLLVIVLTAWGVRELLIALIRPKWLNAILLPGTLVGLAGHALGLLITGATIRDTTLIKDDESGEPAATPNPKSRIPVIGPILIGMLPLVACAAGIHTATRYLGSPIAQDLPTDLLGPTLPLSVAGVWQLLRDQITLAESLVSAIAQADPARWETLLFVYLTITLSIRMAPFPGTARGTLGAIVLLGLVAGAAAWVFDVDRFATSVAWPVMNLTAGMLYALLLLALIIRGILLLGRVLHAR